MTTLQIRGMKCQHCAASTKKALESLGATKVEIDVAKGEAQFEGRIDRETVRQAITSLGFAVID